MIEIASPFILSSAIILLIIAIIVYILTKKTVRKKSSPASAPAKPAGSTSTTPAAAKKSIWLHTMMWVTIILALVLIGSGAFYKLTYQKAPENPFTPTSRIEMMLQRSDGNKFYPIKKLQRTDKKISIECGHGLVLRGPGLGNNEYVGKWTQGNDSGPFTLKFIDQNNARGTLGETTGEIPIVIRQI